MTLQVKIKAFKLYQQGKQLLARIKTEDRKTLWLQFNDTITTLEEMGAHDFALALSKQA